MKAPILKAGALLGFLGFGLCGPAFGEAAVKYSQVEFDVSRVSIQSLGDLGLPVDHHGADSAGMLSMPVSQYDLELLRMRQIPHRLLVDDYARQLELRNLSAPKAASTQGGASALPPPVHFKLGTMGGYLTFAEVVRELDSMRTLYPNLISAKFNLGNSRENRSLWAVRISNQPNAEQNRPKVFYDGLAHAREPMSMMNLMYFMWHVLENYSTDPNVSRLVDCVEMVAVPVMNPDGYEYNRATNPSGGGLWRKNRYINPDGSRGVDLNRNFSTFWGDNSGSSGTGSSDTYRGTSAFSEPETQAIRDFRLGRQFALSLNHHAYANRLLTPYGVGGWPSNRVDYERIATDLVRTIAWQYGPTPLMLGYQVAGAIKDWGHEVAREYAYGAELGATSDGFWPVQARITPLATLVLDMNLGLARNACPTVGIATPGRKLAPEFFADLSAVGGQWVLNYRLSDATRSWYLTVYDLKGKRYKRFALSPSGKSVTVSRGELPRALYLVDVSACKREGCRSVYSEKMVMGGL